MSDSKTLTVIFIIAAAASATVAVQQALGEPLHRRSSAKARQQHSVALQPFSAVRSWVTGLRQELQLRYPKPPLRSATTHHLVAPALPLSSGMRFNRVVASWAPTFDDCYRLAGDAVSPGRVTVAATLIGDPQLGGVVEEARVVKGGTTIDSAALHECLVETMLALNFAPRGEGRMEYQKMFVFGMTAAAAKASVLRENMKSPKCDHVHCLVSSGDACCTGLYRESYPASEGERGVSER